MGTQLEKAINLAKRTGDRVIVVDEKDDSALVLMGLEEYSDLVNIRDDIFDDGFDIKSLTEEELLDKINRDIVMWQEKNKENDLEMMEDDFLFPKTEEDTLENKEENMYYYDEPERYFFGPENGGGPAGEKRNSWRIPSEIKNRAEEID